MDVVNDSDIRQLVADFRNWRMTNPVSGDGLDQMLAFLDQTLSRNIPMTEAIGTRIKSTADDLVAEALAISADLHIATTYFRDMIFEKPSEMDFDPATHYCGAFIEDYDFDDIPASSGFRANWNTNFNRAIMNRNIALYSALSPEPIGTARQITLRTPLMISFAQSAYTIPLYIDSMQLGLLAWDDGAAIAHKIWDHIISPSSVGQLCSLAASETVDPLSSAWISQPFHQSWIRDGLDGVKALPPEITQIMHDPKGRH